MSHRQRIECFFFCYFHSWDWKKQTIVAVPQKFLLSLMRLQRLLSHFSKFQLKNSFYQKSYSLIVLFQKNPFLGSLILGVENQPLFCVFPAIWCNWEQSFLMPWNPTIFNIIRWVAGLMGQLTHQASVWCFKYHFST